VTGINVCGLVERGDLQAMTMRMMETGMEMSVREGPATSDQ